MDFNNTINEDILMDESVHNINEDIAMDEGEEEEEELDESFDILGEDFQHPLDEGDQTTPYSFARDKGASPAYNRDKMISIALRDLIKEDKYLEKEGVVEVANFTSKLLNFYYDSTQWRIDTYKHRINVVNTWRIFHKISGLYRNKLYPKVFVEVKAYTENCFRNPIELLVSKGTNGAMTSAAAEIDSYGSEEYSFIGSNFYFIVVSGDTISFFEKINVLGEAKKRFNNNFSTPGLRKGIISFADTSAGRELNESQELLDLQEKIRDRSSVSYENLKPHHVLSLISDCHLVHQIFDYITKNEPRSLLNY